MRKTLTLLLAAGALGATIAGCGTSRAAGVALVPSGGPISASTTATTGTPTSGPLSTEPTITAGTGTPPSHLVEKNLVNGTGATAEPGDTIVVNYVGALYNTGKVFDASWTDKATFTTDLTSTATSGGTSVIPGWVQGLAGMKVGGRRELIIPPSLAYGAKGQPPTIPKNSTLIFDIDLLKVTK